jgi:phenylacetate-coenzyme A ligase PaaK-like adenylate-forming protein
MREADFFFEIVDPVTGRRVEDGISGEVAFTTLTRRGMPLIRYRTGDISRFIAESCPCGTILKSLEKVERRSGGNVKLGSTGDLSMTELDEALFPLPGLLDFSADLTRENDRDRLRIEILTMKANGKHLADLARSAVRAIHAVRAACEEEALFVSIDVRRKGQIVSNTSGKRRITDLRPQG